MSSVSFSSSHLYLTDGALILLALLLALGLAYLITALRSRPQRS
jgi:hypothetical protein